MRVKTLSFAKKKKRKWSNVEVKYGFSFLVRVVFRVYITLEPVLPRQDKVKTGKPAGITL